MEAEDPRQISPFNELIKRQWIKPCNFLDELEKSICDFLKISSPEETPKLAVNLRHNHKLEPENAALNAWMRRDIKVYI